MVYILYIIWKAEKNSVPDKQKKIQKKVLFGILYTGIIENHLKEKKMLEPKKITLYSGGHKGAEEYFGISAEKYGIKEVTYNFEGHDELRAASTLYEKRPRSKRRARLGAGRPKSFQISPQYLKSC